MKHKSAQVLLKVAFISCLIIGISWFSSGKEAHAVDETSVIIKVAAGEDISIIAADHDAVVRKTIPALGLFFVQSSHADALAQLAADARVTAVYEDTIIEGQPRFSGAVGQLLEAQPWEPGTNPRTAYRTQWALTNMRLTKAHTISQGQNITVAVLDTGVDLAHEQLQGKLVAGYDFVDDDPIPAESRDGLDQDGDISVDEGAGHGTHVAGIVALTAPQAKIMPIRIFDDEGRGLYSNLVAGIVYAVDQGADVINLSGSGPEDELFLAEAAAYAAAHDVVFIAAGGVNSLGYPASYQSVVSVGASDKLDYPTDFSDFPDILNNTVYAPGTSIISGYDDGSYAVWTGNSMATPFVAGTAALMLATGSCDAACAQSILVETSHPVVIDPGTMTAYGRIDAFDAVSAAAQQLHTDLSVMVLDGNSIQTDHLHLRPYFKIVNQGNTVPLHELTLRYWFTRDGISQQQVDCDFATVGCTNIFSNLGLVAGTAVSDTYLELTFSPNTGNLLGGHNSGNIQMRVHKTNWTAYNESNDYSFNGAAVFSQNPQITLYHNGNLVWGEEPTSSTLLAPPIDPAPAAVRVQYRAHDADPANNSIIPHFRLVNDSSSAIPLSQLRLRYWFTDEATAVSQAHCDYAAMGCDKITAVLGHNGSQHYLDLTFNAAAGQLAAHSISGDIQTRLNHTNWQPHLETDDYSFSAAASFTEWQNVTLYQNNVPIWGIEP
ncbi:MAG: S8 family serine peptidase [Anaerolineae bacterium]|nr:S8 family serine peptidase [Anaerolineae bacterium]